MQNRCLFRIKTEHQKLGVRGLSKESNPKILEISKKIKSTVQLKVKSKEWHNSFSKSRRIPYKGVNFYGSWELKFAKFLDSKDVKWEYTDDTFPYIFNGEYHEYNPDFYLPTYDVYIEIKGCPTSKDFAKWEQFSRKLYILFGDDLYDLGIIDSYKNIYLNIDTKFRIKSDNFLYKI